MSVPDPAAPRKLSRVGLYLPFGIAVAVALAWSAAWLWAKGQAQSRMDQAVADLGRAGYQLSWKDRRIGGYPFRLDVTLNDARVREPSGWGLQSPRIEAEAYLHAPGHWMIAAPESLTFVRPEGGPVTVTGKLIHASLFDLGRRPPSFDFEGLNLAFQPQAGAQPFFLASADRVEFHLRAGPDDEGGVFLTVDKGKARLSGLFARIAGEKPISITWNSVLTNMSAFSGPDWPSMVRRWADAGGELRLRQANVAAGDALIGATSGSLTVGRDGRARGVIDVTLRQAPRALDAMSQSGVIAPEAAQAASDVAAAREGPDKTARAQITFQAGRVTLGPVAIGAAPKIYEVR
jgi:hypothetical protein